MTNYNFNYPDWFSHNIPNWNMLKDLLPGRTDFLEIGSFEGRSTVWIAENFAADFDLVFIDCIDTWSGGEEHSDIDMNKVYENFIHNSSLIQSKMNHINIWEGRGTSHSMLIEVLSQREELYDFIYIDGSHQAPDVLMDICFAWGLLKQNGIMVFDDYLWHPNGFKNEQTPKPAIDAFLTCFKGKYKLLFSGYQVAVQKL